MTRPIERREDYDEDLKHMRRFRVAFSRDERHESIRAPVLAAFDIITISIHMSHDPDALWAIIQKHLKALQEEYAKRGHHQNGTPVVADPSNGNTNV